MNAAACSLKRIIRLRAFSLLSLATETAHAVGIACLRRRKRGARKPSTQRAKARPPAQVCDGRWRRIPPDFPGHRDSELYTCLIHAALCLSRSARQASAVSVHRPSTPKTTRRAWITAAATKGSATLSVRPFRTSSPAPATVKENTRLWANKLILII